MPSMTIRNIPEEVHRALKIRAATNGRSAEAEVRQILESVIRPDGGVPLGQLMAAIGKQAGLTDEEVNALDQLRDRTPHEPISFD